MNAKGLLVVISSPSGGGKTSVIRALLQRESSAFVYSISATTRPKRPVEKEGIDYQFVTAEQFERMKKDGALLEWAEVHGFMYGTVIAPLEEFLRKGKIVLLDLDIVGARAIRERYPRQSLLIFIKPPSEKVLLQRLQSRSTETEQEIEKRLTRFRMEMKAASWFDHVILNDDLPKTIDTVHALIDGKMG